MLKKTRSLIITFHETAQAMAAERYCQEHNLPGRMIPVPTEITAGCGLAWKAPPETREILQNAFDGAGIRWTDTVIMEV